MDRSSHLRIGVDTGGTFTDAVVADSSGRFTVGKALTRPERAFLALRDALESAGEQLGLSLSELLRATDVLVYGTTRATNAIVTGRVAKTALLVTAGFRDLLVIKEGGKADPHDFSRSKAGKPKNAPTTSTAWCSLRPPRARRSRWMRRRLRRADTSSRLVRGRRRKHDEQPIRRTRRGAQ
jgi:hypothetical protein